MLVHAINSRPRHLPGVAGANLWRDPQDHSIYTDYNDTQQRDRQQVEQAGECHMCAATRAEAGDIFQMPTLAQALTQAGGIQAQEQE